MSSCFTLIGPGRVGSAIARALVNKGYRPVAIVGRTLASSREACHYIDCAPHLATTTLRSGNKVDLILLAVPDDSIAAVAHQLQQDCRLDQGTVLVHFSGVHPASIMRHPDGRTSLFSLHPLLPFANRQQAFERLALAPYVGEGDIAALPAIEALCRAVGGQFASIPTLNKPLYHAAACISSNYLVTLIAAASALLAQCGLGRDHAESLLLPLLRATLDNVAACGSQQGLTGPIVRGDTGSVRAHLQALQQQPPDLLALYCQLGLNTVQQAQLSGRLEPATAQEIITLLKAAAPAISVKNNKIHPFLDKID